MLQLLDIVLSIVHVALIGFNLFGWICPRTRKAHLITIIVTAASWFILGIWYGMGYCPVTDWQWGIKEKLGESNLPNSFIKYFADKITGKNLNPSLIDTITVCLFVTAALLSVYVNFFKNKKVESKNQ